MFTLRPTVWNMSYQIVAVDDHEVTLSGIAAIVRAVGRCNLAAAVETVDQASDFIAAHPDTPVDLVMLDLRLADSSNLYFTVLRFQEADIPVLIFSPLESPYLIRRALQAGVAGAMQKSAGTEEIMKAIIAICGGDTVI